MFIDTVRNIYQYFYILANNTAQKYRITEVEKDLRRQYNLTQKFQKSLLNIYWFKRET